MAIKVANGVPRNDVDNDEHCYWRLTLKCVVNFNLTRQKILNYSNFKGRNIQVLFVIEGGNNNFRRTFYLETSSYILILNN